MCIEDLWIRRHTIYRPVAFAGTATLKADASRIGVVIVGCDEVVIANAANEVIYNTRNVSTPSFVDVSLTNPAPPTAVTGSFITIGTTKNLTHEIVTAEHIGAAIMDKLLVTPGTATVMFELFPDAILSQYMVADDTRRMLTFVPLNPQIK